jgi:hypothetical protein
MDEYGGKQIGIRSGNHFQEASMLRKLIMLAITSGLAKKLYNNYRAKNLRSPFPTSKRPPEGRARRA